MPFGARPIDQDARRALARRILDGDATAIAELAQLYRDCGYHTHALMLVRIPLHKVQDHVRVLFLED